jgi:hypothetical protein
MTALQAASCRDGEHHPRIADGLSPGENLLRQNVSI